MCYTTFMNSFKSLYRKMVLLSEEDKKTIFSINLMKAWSYLCSNSENKNEEVCFSLLMRYLAVFVSADEVCAEEEYDLFVDSLGLENVTFDEFYELTNFGRSKEVVQSAFELLDSCPKEIDDALLRVGLVMLASDGVITVEEQELFESFYDSRKTE